MDRIWGDQHDPLGPCWFLPHTTLPPIEAPKWPRMPARSRARRAARRTPDSISVPTPPNSPEAP
jgi:hypothetical protein